MGKERLLSSEAKITGKEARRVLDSQIFQDIHDKWI